MPRFGGATELLFCKGDSFAVRQAQLAAARTEVEGLDAFDLSAQREQTTADRIFQQLAVHIPVLDLANVEAEENLREALQQNLWGESFRDKVTYFLFDIPFTGDRNFFLLQPSTFNMNPPRGIVFDTVLRLEVRGPLTVERIKQEYDAQVASVQEYLGWHQKTWADYPADLRRTLAQTIASRKQKLTAKTDLSSGLSALGFKLRGDPRR